MTHVSNEMMMLVMGWEKCSLSFQGELIGDVWMKANEHGTSEPPDITHDLNLVHGIEAGLTDGEWADYMDDLLLSSGIFYSENNKGEYTEDRTLVHATAQQKCDALFPILQERSKK
jgi:hypothetical protein